MGESCGDSLRLRDAGGKTGGAVLMVCRTCGKKGDHWTARCPYNDQLGGGPTETFETSTSAEGGKSSTTTGGAYVPPGMRAGADHQKQPFRRRSEENSLRVTNLTEDTREPDLRELFGTFGPLERAFVAIDQKTGVSRGFGFVTFGRREDAERAINKLNGYGYDNLILGVEWSAPRA